MQEKTSGLQFYFDLLLKLMVEVAVLSFLQIHLRIRRESICPLHMYYWTPCYIASYIM